MAALQKWEISNGPQGSACFFYGRIANFNYFVTTPVEDELGKASAGVSKQTKAVQAHTRRRYPGDSAPVNVSAIPAGRQYLYKANKTSGSARPGKTIIFADVPGTEQGEQRQFQYTGDWKEVIKYLESDAAKDFVVQQENGSKVLITAAAEAAG